MNPKVRQTIYQLGTLIPAVIGILLIWGGIDAGAANSAEQIITGIVSMLGAAAPATAAVKVNQQRKDGTLETPDPVTQAINGVQAVVLAQRNAQVDFNRVQQTIASTIGQVPNLGPLASSILNPDKSP